MDVYLDKMQLVKVAPSLRERAEQFIAGQHHQAVVTRLQRFREELEVGMQPEPWTTLEAPVVSILADICDALNLTEAEKAQVLGTEGISTQNDILDGFVALQAEPLNTRQLQIIARLHEQGRITNGDYQQLCPNVCPETLRLDLVDLVQRGLLKRRGRCRGTHYVAAV